MSDGKKTCLGCNELLPLENFRPFPSGAFGRRPRCIACEKKARNRLTEDMRRDPKFLEGNKVCRVCRELKPKSEFKFSAGNKDGLNNACAICYNTGRKKSYRKNPNLHKLSCKKWRDGNPEHQAEINVAGKARRREKTESAEHQFAREAIEYMRVCGELPRQRPCEICGELPAEEHHPSYERDCWKLSQPLCGRHHYRANRMGVEFKYYTKLLDELYEEHYKDNTVELERCDDGTLGSTGR